MSEPCIANGKIFRFGRYHIRFFSKGFEYGNGMCGRVIFWDSYKFWEVKD